jgi:spore germination protein YaaH/flagellar hook assembly protein FlgD
VTDDRPRPPSHRQARCAPLRALAAVAFAVILVAESGGSGVMAGDPVLVAAAPVAPAAVAPAVTPAATIPPSAPSDPTADVAVAPIPAGQGPDGVQEPSIIALDAAAHEDDRIVFQPGGVVDVPFTPRADDGWSVGGVAPLRLPAGSASGRTMAASRQGMVWAPGSSAREAALDRSQPTGGPGPIDSSPAGPPIAADPASFVGTAKGPLDPPGATDLRRQVFGFLPYWELGDSSTRLDYRLLSTIAYFGVGAAADGDLVKRNANGKISTGWSGWTSARLTSIIKAAHKRHTRVVLTVQSFAWTTNQAADQSALLGSAGARLNLARQIAAAVRDRGADGVNLDFEPLVSGRAEEFTALVRAIRSELNKVARGYQLTFDTTGWIGNYPIEDATAPGGADAIFIMGYDYRNAGSGSAGSIAPLSSAGYDLVDTIQAFTDRVPASKLILGIPYYGRAWSTTTDRPRAKTRTGAKYGWSASVTYANAVELARNHGRRYDTSESSAWIAYKRRNCSAAFGCVTTWREVYYDDTRSLRAKYDTINRYGLRGAGIWALGYDGTRPELYQVIVAKFLHDTTPPKTGIDVLAARQGDEGFVVSWTAFDMNPIRSYEVQVSVDGGPWKAWLAGTRATDAVWPGRNGHAYAFRARSTDAKGNRGHWDVANLPIARPTLRTGGFAVVKAVSLTMRTRPDTSGTAVVALRAGAVVALDRGPVQADGYTWYRVAGPLGSWATTEPVRDGWVAAVSGSTTYLTARTPPNTTIVAAGLSRLSFGAGGATSLGPSAGALTARAFSPNRDGSEDGLVLRWTNGVALDSLMLRVLRANGTTVGTRAVPDLGRGDQAWSWDGTVAGRTLADGRYVLQLVGTAGGRTYSAPSIRPMTPFEVSAYAVTIDTVGPRLAAASIAGSLISPTRDGRHDTVAVSARSAGATRWRLTAARLTGTAVGSPVRTVWGAGGAPRTRWNGRTDAGTPAPDGRYRLTLAVLDPAGNAAARSWDVAVDGTAPTVVMAASPPTFSPDGDGDGDASVLRWTGNEAGLTTVRITHGTKIVRTWPLTGARAGGAIRWTGRTKAGVRLPDGTYQVRLTVQDPAGNRRTTATTVRIDRTVGWPRWVPGAFYPQDLDTLAKTARATFRLARGAVTTLQVVAGNGTVVRTAWIGRRQAAGTVGWTWDGRGAAGAMVAPGSYTVVLTATSSVGTTTVRRAIVADAFAVVLSSTRLKAGRTLTVRFGSVEGLRTRPVVTLDQTGRPPVRRFARLLGPNRYEVSFVIGARGSGPATVRISATDSAGRHNATVRTLSVV